MNMNRFWHTTCVKIKSSTALEKISESIDTEIAYWLITNSIKATEVERNSSLLIDRYGSLIIIVNSLFEEFDNNH